MSCLGRSIKIPIQVKMKANDGGKQEEYKKISKICNSVKRDDGCADCISINLD